jgi:hypothetical protein
MSITLTANYKETLTPEIVEIVDNLVENDYELEEVLTVLDYFGEEYSEHLEAILECRDDNCAENSDLYDFVTEFSIDDLEYFTDYYNLKENSYDKDAVDAYISCCGIESIAGFEEAYEGEFNDVEAFVEYILENSGDDIPSWVVIDHEATWNCSLRHDYFEENGFYFRNM